MPNKNILKYIIETRIKGAKLQIEFFFILRDSFKQPYGYNIKTWMKWILLIKVQIINTDVGKK